MSRSSNVVGAAFVALLAVALLAVELPAATAATPPASPADALADADRAFARDAHARGLDGWMEWFADDSTVFPGSKPPVRGKAEVRAFYESIRFDPRTLDWTPLRGELAASGELGYTYGTWEFRKEGKVVGTGKYMTIWRKQKDGSWKVEADIGSDDPPPAPPAPPASPAPKQP